jgi:hypothetical protein
MVFPVAKKVIADRQISLGQPLLWICLQRIKGLDPTVIGYRVSILLHFAREDPTIPNAEKEATN